MGGESLPLFRLEFFGDGIRFRGRTELKYREVSDDRHDEQEYREEPGGRFDVNRIPLEFKNVHPGDEEETPNERHDRAVKREANPESHTERKK